MSDIQAGPCIMCGATNYSMSFGGPSICPSCDCGIDPEIGKLKSLGLKQHARIAELESQLATVRRDALETEPTENMCDAVRGIIQLLRAKPGCTYTDIRRHCNSRGDDLTLWPAWALSADSYITESGAVALIYLVMCAAAIRALAEPPAQEEGENG